MSETSAETPDARWLVDKLLNGTPEERADPRAAERLRQHLVQHPGRGDRALLDLVTELLDDGSLQPPAEFRDRIDTVLASMRAALYAEPDPPAATLDQLQAAIDAGEPCGRLFKIRNAMDPKSPDQDAANKALRAIGCYLSTSVRTDL